MTDVKYIGMDVHQASISIAVLDGGGALLMQSTIRTQACTLREFLRGLSILIAISRRGERTRILQVERAQRCWNSVTKAGDTLLDTWAQ